MVTIKTWTRGSETIPAVDGRELHKALAIGRDFPTWMGTRLQYGYVEGEDFTTYLVPRGTGTPAKEYLLTLSMAAELCLLDRSEKGMSLRRFILDQQSVQKCSCSTQICTDQKPMWEITRDEMQTDILKACTKCMMPFKGVGEVCQGCSQIQKNQAAKAELVRQRNGSNVTDNEMVQCLIERDSDTTLTVPGSYGTIVTFRRNQYGHAVARIENPQHREQVLKSIFYRSYIEPQEATNGPHA